MSFYKSFYWVSMNINLCGKFKSLSDLCNIAYVKTTNSSNFFLKNNNYLFKSFIFKY